MIKQFLFIQVTLVLLAVIDAPTLLADDIDFRRDIRPILSDKCFHCHGPSEESLEADLRLDMAESALEWAIVPGAPHDSEVIARIVSTDPETVMPPPKTGKALTESEIELLRRWIAEGAEYAEHWAFVAPIRPEVPEADEWARNPIDAFVLQRLRHEGLAPSSQADPTTWLRRLSLDLIGLPPTIEEVEQFLGDPSPDARAKQIRRLMGSPHFGERWASLWLDAARYADSNGYEKDTPRQVWFYRDWVIQALNQDKPYDDFVVEQIAGDLLPNATQEQLVATGFLRNSMVNEEGGADPEQFRVEAMFDRMDAIGKAVLGMTIQCAQCHSHKYDPITQTDYYRMFAFLNNTHDAIVPVYSRDEQQQLSDIIQQIEASEGELFATIDPAEMQVVEVPNEWTIQTPVDLPYEGTKYRVLPDQSMISESYAPKQAAPVFFVETDLQDVTALRIELLTHPQLPRGGPGRSVRGSAAISELEVFVEPIGDPSQKVNVKLVSATADVNPPRAPQPEYLRDVQAKGGDKRVVGPIEFAIDQDKTTAWTTDNDPGRRNQSRNAVFVFDKPVGFPQGTRITIKPTMSHGGWNNNDNHSCLMGRWRFSLTTDADPVADPVPAEVRRILKTPVLQRTHAQNLAVFRYWRTTVEGWSEPNNAIEQLWKRYPEGTTQLVLQERQRPRVTSVLDRGDFLSPTESVEPGVPDFLHPLPQDAGDRRLTFAKWLVDRRSPTTARSIVNRIWQAYFGVGLVETSDDLGSQGTPPSHAELLDWLAVELMENDWRLKHLHELIVSSATYGQSSHVSDTLREKDPYNRLFARAPRFRVDAEIVRDIALASSGLLNRATGGPSVYPPSPRFLYEPPASYGPKTWNEETGENRYRRGLYTFRFRSVPFPSMETFDAVSGNVSCVRRNRSNTPLQALTTLNEPLSMECAESLAHLILTNGGKDDSERLTFAMRRCVARNPTVAELETLQRLLTKQRERLRTDQIDAAKIIGVLRAPKVDDSIGDDEWAAWTLVSRVLLNLDETITKE